MTKSKIQNTIYKILSGIRLRTWIGLGLILVLLPLTIFRVIYNASAAPPVANTRWNFDETSTATAQDYSSNDNDGTITGASKVEIDRCIDGNCLSFDGADDRVSRADDADMDFAAAESFTISLWYKSPPKSALSVVAVKLESVGTDGGYIIQQESDGDITCAIEDDDADTTIDDTISSTDATYDDNKWHHIACVKSTTTSLTLYIDGRQIAQDASLDASSTLANDETFYLGADNGGTTNEFTGFIDEFRMYRSALTSAEIIVDFNFGAAGRFKDQPSDFLTEGLVGYWKMEEAGDATRADSSGNANTLTESASDTVAQVGGKYGSAGDFELGDTEYMTAADSASLSITGSLTLTAWINPETVSAGSYNIIGKWDGSNESYRLFQNADEIRLELDSAGNYQETTASNLAVSTFYHVVGVYDTVTATAKIYINGVEATSTTTGTIPSSIGDDAGVLIMGAEDTSTTPANYYDGIIDQARVYNRALSPAEVKSLYDWGPGPVGHWKLDENTGTSSVSDSSGNDTGLAMTAMESTDWIPGKYGSALDFDGSGEQLDDNADTAILNQDLKNFTVMAWVWRDTATSDDGILSKRQAGLGNTCTGASDTGYQFIIYSTDELALVICDGTNGYEMYTAQNAVATGGWHHVAAVMDRDGNANSSTKRKIYVDGVSVAITEGLEAASFPTGSINSIEDFVIGNGTQDVGGTILFDGRIDDVRVYNYARTAQQVVEDMNGGHPAGGSPIASQAVWWKFDEQYGTTTQDLADTVQSDGTITSTSPWLTYASCKMTGCINFDASGEVVAVATASDTEVDFNGSEKFSLAAWIYVVTSPGASDEDLIIGKWDETNAAEQRGYRLYLTDADTDNAINLVGELYDESANQTLSAATTSEPIALNTWYHVVLTHNGGIAGAAGDLNTYIDGKSAATNSANASFLGVDDVTSDFTVGDYDATDAFAGNTTFAGRIDDVQVFSDQLTAAQVLLVKNAGSAASYGVLATTSEEADVAGSQGTSPIAWYSFDENNLNTCTGGAADACDHSGNAFDLTENGAVTYVAGKYGSAMDFAGDTADDASYNDAGSIALDITSSYTITVWVKFDVVNLNAQTFLIKHTTSSGTASYWFGTSSSGGAGQDELECGGDIGDTTTSALNLAANNWYQLSCVFDDSADTISIYANGVLVSSTGSISGPISTGNSDLYLGGDQSGNWSGPLNGQLDEIKIYNYARTAAQVAYDFNRGKPSSWYNMDDCTGTTVNDLSLRADLGTAIDGTWSGASGSNTSAGTCSAVDTATAWYNGRSGRINYSLDFDGTDDVVTLSAASANSVDANDAITVSAWIYPNSDGEGDVSRIINKTSGSAGYLMFVQGESGGYVQINAQVDQATQDALGLTAAKVPINQWTHVAFTYSSNNILIYINGQVQGADASYTPGEGTLGADAAVIPYIGNRAAQDRTFDGQIDDVRIYSYALPAAQIKKIMLDGGPVRFGPATGAP